MEKTKNYDHVHFSAEVLKEAHQAFLDQVDSEKNTNFTIGLLLPLTMLDGVTTP